MSLSPSPSIHWFRDDLRLADNPALAAAVAAGPTLCLYILDERPERRPLGGASRWWLSRSLAALSAELERRDGALLLLRGDPETLLPKVAEMIGAALVTWSRRYDGDSVALDARIKTDLQNAGRQVSSFNAALLNEPWQVTTKTGDPMKVFTPYWRAARARGEPPAPCPRPSESPHPPCPPD